MKLYKLSFIILVTISLFYCTACSSFSKNFVKGFAEGYNSAANNESSNSSNEKKAQKSDVILSASKLSKDIFESRVISLESDYIDLGTYSVSIIGATFDKATGNVVEDCMLIIGVIDNSFVDTTEIGFNIGFNNSSNAEIEKKDAYLSIYIDYKFDNSNVSQRDSVIPNLDVTATDNENDDLNLLFYSHGDSYVNTECPYGLIVFKGYYDSEFFIIKINDIEYHIDVLTILQ